MKNDGHIVNISTGHPAEITPTIDTAFQTTGRVVRTKKCTLKVINITGTQVINLLFLVRRTWISLPNTTAVIDYTQHMSS